MPDTLQLGQERPARRGNQRRANQLSGSEWVRNSVSIWSDIRKSDEERRLGHPAIFPQQLVNRLIDCFMPPDGRVLLDPFAGTGAAPLAAARKGLVGVGVEISQKYADIATARLGERRMFDSSPGSESAIFNSDALRLADLLPAESVDLVVTSPPYWNVLSQRRTADGRATRDYEGSSHDLSKIDDYGEFLDALAAVFDQVLRTMRHGAYCIVNVMDLRKGDRFYPYHSDLAGRLQDAGFKYDDLIIWDRRHEYNNLRALGYPTVFRINKAHEYLLIFQRRRK